MQYVVLTEILINTHIRHQMNNDISKYKFIDQLILLPFVVEIWLFGSRARGDYQKRSDIDIAIICLDASDSDWIKVTNIIEDADTLLKIDCIRFDKKILSDELYQNILKDKKVLYAKKPN